MSKKNTNKTAATNSTEKTMKNKITPKKATKALPKSKIAGLAEGIGGLAEMGGVDLTAGNLTTGMTSDGRMTFAELMALPSGTPAPAKEDWVRRWSFSSGAVRREGAKVTVEFTDKRKDQEVKTIAEGFALLNSTTAKKG